ncbi:hypothetical protein [Streptomyces rapamycinicus]|uniref:Membrane protein n=2 Tax=Streptomyces rapamycinicus TaxID=1226757 RepID=A0A0A0NNP3_STRRN|nr:hypothetical protein [Streptomyces rapamycinicus]AGP58574.1 membrane protein [Streptomyces rapamycinicus NRRL 5491]MBB4786283.1 hypothetical protein [Streptomyces rapamycinicus]RLV78256.1 membrane protein [Streptomyces rapamycinicus NRRL 5491]UTO66383.1 hypothetical protein LJB45_31355 [Streptomyces rapamycinicus]UTP34337.1 hypothetical protein LIV37_36485 [Streptomyces rapamycinicus NRRL 5491]
MGWTVLYIAFGVVALWLLGEVLLQYKARLRWRLLAFVGFLGVVLGVLIPSVLVIGVGAIAFAVGQTYVTLSFRRGFAAGWALSGGLPGLLGREGRSARPDDADKEPILEVSDLEAVPAARPEPPAYQPEPPAYQPEPPTYQPQPMPDDTGEYGVYEEPSPFTPASGAYSEATADGYSAYETYGGYGAQQDHSQGQGHNYGQDVYADQMSQAGQYGYGNEAYAAYGQDPYGGAQPQAQPYDQQAYDQQAYGQQQYADQYAAYGQQDPYGGTYGGGDHWAAEAGYASPDPAYDVMQSGGPWVPQQREGDAAPPADQQAYPYQQQDQQQGQQPGQNQGYPQGFDDQYRY